ncbi:MAG: WbuC family cupin fold metalloprotein [Tannerellaceae bacterium]|nr:WbuC family cupin fold metalloprotein [Tannerellaceae bacterium]
MKLIDKQLLDSTTEKAKQSPRKRMNHNFHEDLEDPINRLLNAMEPDTYVRPHRHLQPDKDEYFLVLRGKAIALIFDEKGRITEQVLLDPQQGTYGAEIKAGIWHGLLVLESGTVLYEIKPGPFAPLSDDNFAGWSPEPDDKEGVTLFMEQIREATQSLQ